MKVFSISGLPPLRLDVSPSVIHSSSLLFVCFFSFATFFLSYLRRDDIISSPNKENKQLADSQWWWFLFSPHENKNNSPTKKYLISPFFFQRHKFATKTFRGIIQSRSCLIFADYKRNDVIFFSELGLSTTIIVNDSKWLRKDCSE